MAEKFRAWAFYRWKPNLAGEKTRVRAQGVLDTVGGVLVGIVQASLLMGYEIHMGRTGTNRNLVHQENVYGTYLHGLFDRPETTRALVRALMRPKGVGSRIGTGAGHGDV